MTEGLNGIPKYSNNYDIGKATVKVIGIGNYTGEKTKTFQIKPRKIKLLAIKNIQGRQMSVYWKQDASVEGVQILYSTNRNFKKAKKISVGRNHLYYGNGKNYTLIGKLKKKKTYYVKLRAYGSADGKRIYGAYSNVKSVKIKK